MAKPRYDKDKDESRHAAADRKDCEKMANRQKWRLKDVEIIGSDPAILKVDCVFEGKTEFPENFYDGDNDE
ncbi:hypothetical protein H6F44_09825 [Pseudanabaena sp. FACHB-1277]|jgi:hypothetical protein|uniref:Uncharacterized protein n=1 Tax=Pseudanabaena cinerea FACHB-1277 TaxID=2949581 RepID=A0A926USG1_9CYAN|nr:hypothetical protein [Pseudanabaena cinerea]MBD2150414.1 hypothetical protein [Pseudanabaena cinerea FACHB-1277]